MQTEIGSHSDFASEINSSGRYARWSDSQLSKLRRTRTRLRFGLSHQSISAQVGIDVDRQQTDFP